MSIHDALKSLPDDALVPVRWVREHLAHPAAQEPSPTADVAIDRTVGEVATLFNKKPSTVRTWCEHGRFPGAYRLHGREWRIPASAIAAFQREQASQPPKPQPQPPSDGPVDIGAWRKHVRV